LTRQGHALGAVAAQQPAEAGAPAAEATQGVLVEQGVRVLIGGEVRGEEPVLAQEVLRAAGGVAHREGGEQGQQQQLERHRNPGVQDRPRQGARCVGFDRSGGLMGHHR
jgi:hypothetical protein